MTNLSKEYALALFMLAKEEDKEREYLEALDMISEMFIQNPKYKDFLASPRIKNHERSAAVKEAFGEYLPANVLNFLRLLGDEGQMDDFDECTAEYKLLMLQDSKLSEARVTSVVELNEEEKARLHEKLENMSGNPVTMEYAIDETLLGGMIVEIDGKIIDGSLRSRLKEMKEVISK